MADFEPDVGVLIVHGIGTQTEGSELRHWVDSVLPYLEALRPAPAAGGSAPAPILEPNLTDDKLYRVRTPSLAIGGNQRWLVGEAWWAEAFDVPDRKEVTRWLVDIASWFIYLFVVRIWRRFHVDGWHIASGVAFAASVTYFFHQCTAGHHSLAMSVPVMVCALLLFLFTLARPKGRKLGGVVVAMSLLIVFPLAALATTGVVLLWLIGLLPGKISAKVRKIQLSAAGSVGDVYALISSERRERAMFDAIASSLHRLTTSHGMVGKPIVLVAHSMGSALTYRALNKDPALQAALAGRKVTLVTYGEAIVPMLVLEHRLRDARPTWVRLQGLLGLVGLLLFAFSLAHVATDAIDGASETTAIASLVIVVASFLLARRQERRARCSEDKVTVVSQGTAEHPHPPSEVCLTLRAPRSAHLRWVDLWAPWDPVPNGPLSLVCPCTPTPCRPDALPLPADEDQFLSCRVSNTHQPWRDHVVYRANPEDVVSRWVGEIAARAKDVPPVLVERPGATPAAGVADVTANANAARDWRRRRGVALFLTQFLTVTVGMVATFWHWKEMDELGRRAADRLSLVRTLVDKVVNLVPEGFRDGVFGSGRDSSHLQGLLVAIAVVAVIVLVESSVVGRWQSTATSRFMHGRDDQAVAATAGLALSAVVGGLVLIVSVLALLPMIHLKESPTRPILVSGATIAAAADGVPTTSEKTTVTFEPVGTDKYPSVVVALGDHDKPRTATLVAKIAYRVTATATGAKDCIASYTPATDPQRVTVTCAPSAVVLPKAGTSR